MSGRGSGITSTDLVHRPPIAPRGQIGHLHPHPPHRTDAVTGIPPHQGLVVLKQDVAGKRQGILRAAEHMPIDDAILLRALTRQRTFLSQLPPQLVKLGRLGITSHRTSPLRCTLAR